MSREFKLPDLGEGITEAQIVRVLVQEGDRIEEDQYLMEVETDKAAVEIPSPYAGIVQEIFAREGQTVNVGDVVVSFDGGVSGSSATSVGTSAKAKAQSASATGTAATAVLEAPPPGRTTAPAAPAVRRLARELRVDLDRLKGSGPGGRITRDDVEQSASPRADASPGAAPVASRARAEVTLPGEAGADKWGPVSREPLNQIRKTIASQMARSAFTAVHVTHGDEADVTELDALRRRLNETTGGDPKLTLMAFVIRATCLALQRNPVFNASFDEEGGQVIYKSYVNMGIAVDSDRGLVVPVLRNAERLSLTGIAGALSALADQIRGNRFAVDDLRGGSFTITNIGAIRGTVSTPIINYPEVAILGLGRSRWMPVIRDGEVAKALVLPINLSFDHRVTDGANAARFADEIISYLEMPAKFLLD